MKYLKKKYAEILAWADDSEVVLLARGIVAVGIGIAADTLSGLNFSGIVAGEVNWKSALATAAFGAFLEWLRRHRAEDV
jgi:hypothetical protein